MNDMERLLREKFECIRGLATDAITLAGDPVFGGQEAWIWGQIMEEMDHVAAIIDEHAPEAWLTA